jgi:hypothetical protein
VAKPETDRPFSLLGVVFVIAGVVILILALLNYLQDGRISLAGVMGFIIISLGLLLYSRGKSLKDRDE